MTRRPRRAETSGGNACARNEPRAVPDALSVPMAFMLAIRCLRILPGTSETLGNFQIHSE